MSQTTTITRLVVLLFSDIVGSVELKSRLGDAEAAQIIAQHDRLFRRTFDAVGDGEILKDTGDGFLARFNTVSSAVSFALLFQDAMRREPWPGPPLHVRIGLHLGEVSELEADPQGGAKLSGLAIDLAARIMGLAEGGQILLTRALFDSARQYVRKHPPTPDGRLLTIQWMAHGPYRFKGTDEPLEVFEVGAQGESPLRAPRDSEKAQRAVAPGQDETLGWRPATGLEVPTRPGWKLEKRIGEGGFGEVWLGTHEKTRVHRAFKFCFDQDRLRSLKRELTLFRVLREVLGDRDDIARLYEVQLERAPYFLEVEFTEAGDLNNWARQQGGLAQVPVATRLDLAARTARAVAAAHSVGVLHKDIKPSNILIQQTKGSDPRPRLADFGIGILADRTALDARQITMTGFTGLLSENESSRTGTRLYAPPEMLIGKAFTVQGDIYALGVLLYQLIVADLERPLAVGWERDIDDALLREDISRCVEGDPSRRLRTADELAERLEQLPRRRRERLAEIEARDRAERRQRLMRLSLAAIIVLAALLGLVGVGLVRERDLRRLAEIESEKNRRIVNYLRDMFVAARVNELGRHARVVQVLDPAAASLDVELKDEPALAAALRSTFGSLYLSIGVLDEGERLIAQALEDLKRLDGPEARTTLLAMNALGLVRLHQRALDEADELLTTAWQAQRRRYGESDQHTLEFGNDVASLRVFQQRFEDAFAIFRETIAAHRAREGGFGKETVSVTANYAHGLLASGDIAESERLLREAYEAAQSQWGEESYITLAAANNYGQWLLEQQRFEEVVSLLDPLLPRARNTLGPHHPDTVIFATNLAAAMLERKDTRCASLLDEIVAVASERLGRDHPASQFAIFTRIRMLAGTGQSAELEQAYMDLLRDRESLYGEHAIESLRVKQELADLLEKLGRGDEAERLHLEVIASLDSHYGPNHPEAIFARNNFAAFYRDARRLPEAAPWLAAAASAADKSLGEDNWQRWFIHGRYGRVLRELDRFEEAEVELRRACEGLEATLGLDDGFTQEALGELVRCYEQLQRPAEAQAYRDKVRQGG